MPGFTVFYAWQSDLDEDVGKKFIRKAAEVAIKSLSRELVLDDSPRLDHDTKDVSGLPVISDTIMRKIDDCAVFLADVSLVAEVIDKRDADQGRPPKRLPNPNVLIELGYAWARIGWPRLILVMNKRHGDQEQLPFDLRNRRYPHGFEIASDRHDLEAKLGELADYLKLAIKGVLQQEHQRVTDIVRKLDGATIHFLRHHSGDSHFWEVDAAKNAVATAYSRAIIRLLELDITELVSFAESPNGYAYTWTYIGRLVLQRLHLAGPSLPVLVDFSSPPPAMITDLSWYDGLSSPPEQ